MSIEPTRIYVPPGTIFEITKNCLRNKEPFISGHNSLYVMRQRVKFLDDTACFEWPNLRGEMIRMTRGEAAKTELKREWPDLRRVGWRRNDIQLLDKVPPVLYSGPGHFRGTYVDLKAAYWSLYRQLWLNTAYPRGFGTLSLVNVAERVKDSKPVRNAIIGAIRSRNIVVGTKEGQLKQFKSRNPFLSPGLWATIQDALHELAIWAKTLGAVYINTDGYIFPNGCSSGEFMSLLRMFGYKYTEFTGDIDIRGWGSYKIGDFKRTSHYDPNYTSKINQFSNLAELKGSTIIWMHNTPDRLRKPQKPAPYLLKKSGKRSKGPRSTTELSPSTVEPEKMLP